MIFSELLNNLAKKIDINLNTDQLEKFAKYKDLILEWNQKVNLTAITDEKEIILKHFIDSMTLIDHIKANSSVVDIGTGAGFPGIPLKIFLENKIEVTLLDSLNKRVNFLNLCIENLNLENIYTKHLRAEEAGSNKQYREKFDYCVSRAVANLPVLIEYCMPLVKLNGYMIAMKGSNVEEEVAYSNKAIFELGGKVEKVEMITLPESDIVHSLVVIKKIRKTLGIYPRKAGKIEKSPLRD